MSDYSFKPSAEFESRLFSAAEDLLFERRARIAARSRATAKRRELLSGLAFRPSFQISTLAALLALALNLSGLPRNGHALTFADLPEISQSNDAGARYDAEIQQERIAYQKEVEDAHRETQGGS